MKYEILFRGKRLDNRAWVQGSLISFIDGGKMILPSKSSVFQPDGSTVFCSDKCYQVDPNTVGRYTGLTDKNGVRIFEGDILASRYDDSHPENISIEVVKWLRNSWYLQQQEYLPNLIEEEGVLPDAEVIGSIHDNPELLEGGAV